jgi:hypothetical protein
MRQFVFFWFFVCALAGPAKQASGGDAAERADSPLRIWLGAGLGVGSSSESNEGLSGLSQLVFQRGHHYAALRAQMAGDPQGEGSSDTVAEIGLLYGRARVSPKWHAAIASGLALVGVESCEGSRSDKCTTVGIPVIAEVAFQASVVGIGFQAFTNFNSKSRFSGAVLFIQLGWMPDGH